jgi:hypothetical protein
MANPYLDYLAGQFPQLRAAIQQQAARQWQAAPPVQVYNRPPPPNPGLNRAAPMVTPGQRFGPPRMPAQSAGPSTALAAPAPLTRHGDTLMSVNSQAARVMAAPGDQMRPQVIGAPGTEVSLTGELGNPQESILPYIDDAARVAIGTPLEAAYENVPGAKTVIDLFNKPYEWNVDRVGGAAVDRANGKGQPGLSNPYYYIDANLDTWAADPANKDRINAVFANGLDLNDDGTVDVTGGEAVYMVYAAETHPGFIDTLITGMAMDPLFVASFVAPAASSARTGVQVAGETAVAGSKTATILRAADASLGVVTKAGDIGNAVADAPFTMTVAGGRLIARGTGAVPGPIGSASRWIGGLGSPGAKTVERTTANTATDVADAAQMASAVPVYSTNSAGVPTPGVTQANAQATVGGNLVQAGITPANAQATVGGNAYSPNLTQVDAQNTVGGNAYPAYTPDITEANVQNTVGGNASVYDDNLLDTRVIEPEDATPEYAPDGINEPTQGSLVPEQQALPDEPTIEQQIAETDAKIAQWKEKIRAKPEQRDRYHPSDSDSRQAIELLQEKKAKLVASVPEQQALPETPITVNGTKRTMESLTDEERIQAIRDPNNPVTELTPRRGDGRFISKVREMGDENPAAWDAFVKQYRDTPMAGTNKSIMQTHLDSLKAVDDEIAQIEKWTRPGPDKLSLPQAKRDALFVRRSGLVNEANVARIEHTIDTIPIAQQAFGTIPDIMPDVPRVKAPTKSGKASFTNEGTPYLMQKYVYEDFTPAGEKKASGALEVLRHRPEVGGHGWWAEIEQRLIAAREKLRQIYGDMQNVGFAAPGFNRFVGKAERLTDPDAVASERFLADSEPRMQALRGAVPDDVAAELAKTIRTVRVKKNGTWVDGARRDIDEYNAKGKQPIAEAGGFKRADIEVADISQLDLLVETARRMPDASSAEISHAFAERVLDLTGARIPARQRYGPVIERLRNVVSGTNSIARETALYNPVTGFRGIIADFVSDHIRMAMDGNLSAALDPGPYLANMRGADTEAKRVMDSFGLDMPNDLKVKRGRTEVEVGDRTSTHQALNKAARAKEGSGRDKALGVLAGLTNSQKIAKWRNASDNVRRESVFLHTFLKGEFQMGRAFRERGRAWADKHGILPQSFDAYLTALGARYTPEQLRGVMRELGEDAGLRADMAVNFADRLARDWSAATNKLKRTADAEQKRVLFSYERTKLDDFLGNFIFFHYWMSRAVPAYLRIGLRNPEMAAMWIRTWEDVKERAEASGYPDTMKGYIRFMGSPDGWNFAMHPLGIIMPLVDMMPDAQAEGWYEQLTQFVAVNPIVKSAAAVVGLTDEVADPLMTYPIRNMLMSGINKIRAETGRNPVADPYEEILRKTTEWANALYAASPLPAGKERVFMDPMAFTQSEIQYNVAEIVAQQTGVPTDQWVVDGPEYQLYTEAVADGMAGIENPIYQQALDEWATADLEGRGLNSVVPGGVRTRYAPRDAMITAEELTPEQQTFKQVVNAGSPESATMTLKDEEYHAIGTPRQQALAEGWRTIAYPEATQGDVITGEGLGVTIGGEWIAVTDLLGLEQADRSTLADAWVAEQRGTDSLQKYRDERAAFLTDNPEYGSFVEWQGYVYDQEDQPGGIKAWRESRAEGNPNFKYEMREYENYLKEVKGITDRKVLDAELDRWAAGMNGYMAAQGIRNDVYDRDPGSTGDQPTVDAMRSMLNENGGGGSSGGAKKKKSTTDKLKADLKEYETDMKLVDQTLKNYGIDLGPGGLTNVNGYYHVQALDSFLGDLIPKPTALMKQYEEWVTYQPRGADTSPEAFGHYLDKLAADESLDELLTAAAD